MRNYTKEEIEKVISESPDMITALEAVGAMYGIPPSHIMAQPGLKSIRVENDMILAPADVKPNTKAIVCSIGAVLDQISQRINDKLDNFQIGNIQKGQIEDKVVSTANPSKGRVLSHHTADDGSEIIIYDTGLVDYPKTPAARAKVEELKASGMIPDVTLFNDTKYEKPSYFTTEDDIALDDKTNKQLSSNDPTPTDISNEIHEADMHLEMCAHYNDTDYLGYDVFSEMGFDFIRKTDAFITEAAKVKSIKTKDIKHMKFDNKEITRAIQCFNEARAEQSKVGKGEFNIKQFINHPKYKEAVKHLENQFDCQLAIIWYDDKENPDDVDLYTSTSPAQIIQKLTISKSKGFQLNGLPIRISIINKAIDEEMSKDANLRLFGQFVCSSLCHEIFHNIANAIRIDNSMFIFSLESAMTKASMTDNVELKKVVFNQYAKTLTKTDKGIVSLIARKRLVSELCKVSALSKNQTALNEIQNSLCVDQSASVNIDQLIKHKEAIYNKNKPVHDKWMKQGKKYDKRNNGLLMAIGTALCLTIVGSVIGIPMILSVADGKMSADYMHQYEKYLKIPNKEEYYCDLFAGMYNLPLSFTIGYQKRDFTANMVSEEQLKKLSHIEAKLSDLLQSEYPTISERNYAAYTIAKNILAENDKLPKEYKEYCQWIVDNYSKIESTDIGTNYRKQSFNPNEADDLDRHVHNLIDNNKITLTESAS